MMAPHIAAALRRKRKNTDIGSPAPPRALCQLSGLPVCQDRYCAYCRSCWSMGPLRVRKDIDPYCFRPRASRNAVHLDGSVSFISGRAMARTGM